jgi:hypothetical protein
VVGVWVLDLGNWVIVGSGHSSSKTLRSKANIVAPGRKEGRKEDKAVNRCRVQLSKEEWNKSHMISVESVLTDGYDTMGLILVLVIPAFNHSTFSRQS